MANPTVNGQLLLDELNTRLGGIVNAFSTDELLSFLSDGKDKVWSVLKSLGEDYSVDDTQNTTAADEDYFADVTTTAREYNLPKPCREIRLIECLTDGYKHLKFEQRNLGDVDFQEVRRYATEQGTSTGSVGVYYYAVLGRRTIMFADYFPVALNLKIWAVFSLDDVDPNTEIPQILHPFWRSIVDYAAKIANLSIANLAMDAAWLQQWQISIRDIANSAFPRSSEAPRYIESFWR